MKKTNEISLEKYAQVISSDLMDVLKQSAEAKNISIDMEIALRLMAGLTHSDLNRDASLYSQIINKSFSHDDAIAECKRRREEALRLYETEKLRLYLRFEKNLPRDVKEGFLLIDVKAMTKIIKAELALEDEENKEGHGE